MITKLEVNGPSQYDHLKCATREEVKKVANKLNEVIDALNCMEAGNATCNDKN